MDAVVCVIVVCLLYVSVVVGVISQVLWATQNS